MLLDLRLPVAGACLTTAVVRIAPSAAQHLPPIGVLLAVASLGQIGFAGAEARSCDMQHGKLRAALQALPRCAIRSNVAEETKATPSAQCSRLPLYDRASQVTAPERSRCCSTDFVARLTSVVVRCSLPTDQNAQDADAVIPDMVPPGGYPLWMHPGRRRPVSPDLRLLRAGSFFSLFSAP